MKPKILIVDNEAAHLQSIIDIIQSTKTAYIIYKTRKPCKAIHIANSKEPDLIITDWDMPQMTGLQVIHRLKKDDLTCDIPIIMCTGIRITSTDLDTALGAGAVDFIRKPVDPIELLARTRTMLKLGNSYRQIKRQNKQLAHHLEIQQERMVEIAKTMVKKNEIIAELQAYAPKSESQKRAWDALSGLRELLDTEKDWAVFEAHFSASYPKFLTHLIESFPKLTKQELRICMLVKIGLTSLQIADMLFVSKRSIDSHRNHLRKKISLTPDQKLTLFLETI